jgi:hypothetical protein
MSRQNYLHVTEIIKLGHNIGLHYDQGFDLKRNISIEETSNLIIDEASWLEKTFKISVDAVSFHQPSSIIFQEKINCVYRVNTYDKELLSKFSYISDSNRTCPLLKTEFGPKSNPQQKNLKKFIDSWSQNVQLLIHPMWWVYENETTEEVWDEVIKSNFYQMQIQLLETERAFGRERHLNLSFF